jgi:hypothetical protein
MVVVGLPKGIKRLEFEATHSILFTAQAKCAWSFIFTPPYASSSVVIKHRDCHFIFTFTC